MCSGESDWTCLQPGFPIRKSSDHSLVIDSPRLIADSYVLLRFLVPRHPPCALKNLSHKDARVHCAVLNIQAAPHPTGRLPHAQRRGTVRPGRRPDQPPPTRGPGPEGNLKLYARDPQDPTTCQAPPPTRPRSTARSEDPTCTCDTRWCQRQLIDVPPLSTCCPTLGDRPGPGPLAWPVLLRKEVIQPHLPVRLPCYDLVPIASPTFDGSPSCELGHRLRVLPTFVT